MKPTGAHRSVAPLSWRWGAVMLIVLLAACSAPILDQAAAPTDDGTWQVLSIARGTHAVAGDLGVGLLSVRRADRVDEQGTPRRLTAALALSVRGDPPTNRNVDVRAGERLQIAGYTVFVLEVRDDGGPVSAAPGASNGQSVRLSVKPPV